MRYSVASLPEAVALFVAFLIKVTVGAVGVLLIAFVGHAQSEIPSTAPHILVLGQESSNASYPYLIDTNGTAFSAISVQEDLSQLSDFVSLDCSSSGDFILFSAGQMYKMKPDGSKLELIFDGGYVTSIAISPDNTRVAFSGMYIQPWYSAAPAIFLMDIDGSNLVKLTQNSFIEEEPTWSPDGQKIAFAYDDSGTQGIAVIGVDGSDQTRITESSYYDAMPHWSPDSQRIAFASNRNGDFNIYSTNIDGSDLEQLTASGTGQNVLPKWSPNGAYLSFSSDHGGEDYEIYRMNADGSHVIQLTENSGYDFNQCWLVPQSPNDY
jgi:Tol biopolymer transport system component